jgi:hypothetical protein
MLNMGYKIFSNILYERLQPHVQRTQGNYQSGFRVGKSTIDQITVNETDSGKKHWNIDSAYFIFSYISKPPMTP